MEILFGRKERFKIGEIGDMEMLEAVETALSMCNGTTDRFKTIALEFRDGARTLDLFSRELFSIFYDVGIVGLQKAQGEPVSWTFESRRSLSRAEITNETRANVHPMLFRRLGIRTADEPPDDSLFNSHD